MVDIRIKPLEKPYKPNIEVGVGYTRTARKMHEESRSAMSKGNLAMADALAAAEKEMRSKAIAEYTAALKELNEQNKANDQMVSESLGAVRSDSQEVVNTLKNTARCNFLLGEEYAELGYHLNSAATYNESAIIYAKLGFNYQSGLSFEKAAIEYAEINDMSKSLDLRVMAASMYGREATKYMEKGMLKLSEEFHAAEQEIVEDGSSRDRSVIDAFQTTVENLALKPEDAISVQPELDIAEISNIQLAAKAAKSKGNYREAALLYGDTIVGVKAFINTWANHMYGIGPEQDGSLLRFDAIQNKVEQGRSLVKYLLGELIESCETIVLEEEMKALRRGSKPEASWQAIFWSGRLNEAKDELALYEK